MPTRQEQQVYDEDERRRVSFGIHKLVLPHGEPRYRSTYNSTRERLETENAKPEAERKSIEELKVELSVKEPTPVPAAGPEANGYHREMWRIQNDAVRDALEGKPPKYEAPFVYTP